MNYEATTDEVRDSWLRVDARRRARRVTWSAVAWRAGVSEGTLRRWRQHDESPGIDAGRLIAVYLGMKPEAVWAWQYD